MHKLLFTLLLLAGGAFCGLPDSGADTAASLRPGAWGLGARMLGSTTNIYLFRAVSSHWNEFLAINWNTTNTDHNSPASSAASTSVTTYDFAQDTTVSSTPPALYDTETVVHSHTLTFVLGPEYDRPVGHGLDLTAYVGLYGNGSWNTNQTFIDNAQHNSTSYSRTWSLNGGAQGALGLRWWFLPQRLALAGEFATRISGGYTSAHGSSSSVSTSTTANYTSVSNTGASSSSGTWNLTASTYTCSLGLDAFF
jgi:hypothetical protein